MIRLVSSSIIADSAAEIRREFARLGMRVIDVYSPSPDGYWGVYFETELSQKDAFAKLDRAGFTKESD
jgi:hypothetical protein